MCPVSGPSGVDIVVIDKSDEWNESQKIRLRNAIVDIQSAIERDRLLEIFVFSDLVEVGFQPMFSNCSPGRGSETNEFIDNPRMRQQAFDQGFERPLAEILTQLAEPDSGSSSPILEVLSDISSRVEYRGIDGDRRIVVISDMIQNSEALSLFPRGGAPRSTSTLWWTPPAATSAPASPSMSARSRAASRRRSLPTPGNSGSDGPRIRGWTWPGALF